MPLGLPVVGAAMGPLLGPIQGALRVPVFLPCAFPGLCETSPHFHTGILSTSLSGVLRKERRQPLFPL